MMRTGETCERSMDSVLSQHFAIDVITWNRSDGADHIGGIYVLQVNGSLDTFEVAFDFSCQELADIPQDRVSACIMP